MHLNITSVHIVGGYFLETVPEFYWGKNTPIQSTKQYDHVLKAMGVA